ncbi:hypothetical protein HYW17_02850 [Candidatus Uhrbacteria bacterium]|nr:hypothetical protein [Candidatus Uhrbacteria bacterium]
MTRERAAVAEADRLQQEVWTRLAAHNFRFRTDYWDHLIAHQRAMDLGDRAAVSAENVERFWSGMQQFLEGRVARLSKAAGIPS